MTADGNAPGTAGNRAGGAPQDEAVLHGVVLPAAAPATGPGGGNEETGPGAGPTADAADDDDAGGGEAGGPPGGTGGGLAAAGGAAPERPAPRLAADALARLDADLGQVQVARVGGRRVYRRRIELLAEVCTPQTFALVLDWLSSTRRASPATKRNYADDLRRVWAPLAREAGHDAFSVGCLTRDQVRMWRLRQENDGAAKRSIGRYVACLSSLHAYAAGRLDPPPRNPVTQDDRPRIESGRTATSTPVLEAEQVRAVAAAASAASGELDLLVVMLLYSLAGRVTEICAADVADLDREGDRVLLTVTRKGGRRRRLPLPARCAELLAGHVGARTGGPLLLDAKGDRLDRHDVDRISTRLGRAAGVLPGRDLTPHVWRASRITHMLDAGVPLAEVQEFADHIDPATTIGYWERRNQGRRAAAHADQAAAVFDA